MSKYRSNLPQLSQRLFLTDAGMETTLIFHEGLELPHFASFDLLKTPEGVEHVRRYYEPYIAMAKQHGLGFIFEAPTWRANLDWGAKLGYSREALAEANRGAIALMADMRREHETARTPIVLSGNIGPRGDGYKVESAMTAKEAEDYHGFQVGIFRDSAADMVSAFTINYVEEAIGVVRAAKAAEMPVVISFTLETDGKLPTGQSLKDAITQTDRETGNAVAYYMINCAHPAHFEAELQRGGKSRDNAWLKRLRGLRANSSKRSHAELDAAPDLDIGNPVELGGDYRKLRTFLPHLTVLGGCCGTDHRHVEQICAACVQIEAAA
jgi:S-methylmethionine-dependent homocysteine/selenocysteine methylase